MNLLYRGFGFALTETNANRDAGAQSRSILNDAVAAIDVCETALQNLFGADGPQPLLPLRELPPFPADTAV